MRRGLPDARAAVAYLPDGDRGRLRLGPRRTGLARVFRGSPCPVRPRLFPSVGQPAIRDNRLPSISPRAKTRCRSSWDAGTGGEAAPVGIEYPPARTLLSGQERCDPAEAPRPPGYIRRSAQFRPGFQSLQLVPGSRARRDGSVTSSDGAGVKSRTARRRPGHGSSTAQMSLFAPRSELRRGVELERLDIAREGGGGRVLRRCRVHASAPTQKRYVEQPCERSRGRSCRAWSRRCAEAVAECRHYRRTPGPHALPVPGPTGAAATRTLANAAPAVLRAAESSDARAPR